ncbi:MAG: ShlB/FhaC/HecB family hemolysin secretion/activation protein [Pseudomonas sp.]
MKPTSCSRTFLPQQPVLAYFVSRYKSTAPVNLSLLASALCAALYIPSVSAEPLLPSASPAIRELDLQDKQRTQEEIQRKLDKSRQGSSVQLPAQPAELSEGPQHNTGPTFHIDTISIDTGEYADYAVDTTDILHNYENRELGNADLFSLIRDVTNRYAEQGFSTTTITLVPKNMKQGQVELKVNWGLVEGWLVNGEKPDGTYKEWVTAFAMPNVVAKPLNIHEVDQMVENLNNAAKTARIDIQPSPRLGYSYLNLVTEEKPLAVTVRADNSGLGSPSNGRYRYSASTSIGDLLLGNDTLGLNLSSRRYQVSDSNSEYNAGINYSVPFGYSRVDLRFNHSQYEKAVTGGRYGDYDSSGNSQNYSAKFSQVLMREKAQKLTASVELEHKENFNYLEKSLIQTSSKPYTSLGYGLEHLTQLLGGSLYSDITFSHGISAWGAAQAAYDKNQQSKHFKKIEFNTAWSRSFNWFEQAFDLSSRIGGQYAKDNLITAEQLGIGDEFTVRGFRGPALWGDQGIYFSNTLSMPIQLLGGTVSPLIGLDTGYVRNVAYSQQNGGITGLAIGANANWRYGGASITLGVPLTMDDTIRKSTDATALYMSTYLSF